MSLYSNGHRPHSTAIHSFEVLSLESGDITNDHQGWEILFGGASDATGCEFIVQGRQFDLSQTPGLIFNGRDRHHEVFRTSNARLSALVIEEDFILDLLGSESNPDDLVFLEPRLTPDQFLQFAKSIHLQLRSGLLSDNEIECMTSSLVFEILDSRLHNRKDALGLKRGNDDLLTRLLVKDIVTALHHNVSNSNYDLNQLAEDLGVTKFHAIRAMKRMTNMTPAAYLANLRLRLARRLLKDGRISVAVVAMNCGYVDLSTFNKAFKRAFGHVPTSSRLS